MMLRKAVEEFIALGPFPPDDTDDVELVRLFEEKLHAIPSPLTREEADALLGSFSEGTCYGLAWTLLHLVETAPGQPLISLEPDPSDEWRHLLWRRWQNYIDRQNGEHQ